MRDFLLENPIDYKMGRGRLSSLHRVNTTVESQPLIKEEGLPFDKKTNRVWYESRKHNKRGIGNV